MSSESWPPQLKDWVAKCLGQMTDSNRAEAQTELREVIADAFQNKRLWTTDWAGVQLQSLLPKPIVSFNNLKRKSNENTVSPKKTKKSALKQSASHIFNPNDQAALDRRAQRFQREHQIERMKNMHVSWPTHSGSSSPFNSANSDEPEANSRVPNWDKFTIVGTSQEIFKEYLRLTSEPKPDQIRPYHVLQQTLIELKKRWKEKASYNWICNQFKSVRQDLTVQRIKNEFTVQVYEIHARMALESGDMVEYNQCQNTLKTLYELGIPGNVAEFTAYQILLLLHGRNKSEMNLFVGRLTTQQKADSAVRHALDVQRALSVGNYHSLFDLYINAPNMGGYIMDHFIPRERVKAMMIMAKAYISLSLTFLETELAFDDMEQLIVFLTEHSSALFVDPSKPPREKLLDCKAIQPHLAKVFEEKYRKVGIKGAI